MTVASRLAIAAMLRTSAGSHTGVSTRRACFREETIRLLAAARDLA
jgi:hypothetical protein